MLAAVFGDTHGNLNSMYATSMAWESRTGFKLDLVIQVGDFGFWLDDNTVDQMSAKHTRKRNEEAAGRGLALRPVCGDFPEYVLRRKVAPTRTLVIRGNHEDQEFLMQHEKQNQAQHPKDYLERAIQVVPNIFYLPDGHVVDIDGVKFGGLGGNFSEKTFKTWDYWHEHRKKVVRGGEKRRLNHFTRDRWELLIRSEMDVLLLHDAPTELGLLGNPSTRLPKDEQTGIDGSGRTGCPYLKELIDAVQPRYAFCGHWHQYRSQTFGRTKCTVLDLTAEQDPSPDCMTIVDL
jgi:lariat debranching enzyme